MGNNNEKIRKPKDYLDTDPEVRKKQLEAIQEYLLAEGRNDEEVNSELLELRSKR